jgi:hypothetical protein
MAAEELTPEQRKTTADDARHRRVEELIAALAAPTFRWRMAWGIVGTPGAVRDDLAVNAALKKSARTRLTNAEREIDDVVVDWIVKHFDTTGW